MPTVTTITRMFNAEATIARAIDSLRAQSLTDWQLIIVDDGSTDRSHEIAAHAARADPRITLLSQPNRGVSAAANRGLDHAAGDYIHFLDADDALEPRALETLTRAAADTGAAHGMTELCGPEMQPLGRQIHVSTPTVTLDHLLDWNRFHTVSHIVRRDLYADLRFDESLAVVEDYDAWTRLALRGVRWRAVEQTVCRYRLRPGTMSKRFAEMARCQQRVIADAYRRARESGWAEKGIDLSDRRRDTALKNCAFLYATMAALADPDPHPDPDNHSAAEIYNNCPARAPLTPDEAAQALCTALPLGLCAAPDIDGESEQRWLPAALDWWRACARRAWLEHDRMNTYIRTFAEKSIHPYNIARAMLGRAGDPTRISVIGTDRTARWIVRAAAERGVESTVLDTADDPRERELMAVLEPAETVKKAAELDKNAKILVANRSLPDALARALPRDDLIRWTEVRAQLGARNARLLHAAIDHTAAQRRPAAALSGHRITA